MTADGKSPLSPAFGRSVAAHEAGHAAVAILDSNGKNIPDYWSIVPGADFKGVVAESIAYRESLGGRTTYADFRHQIRVRLAGRAAEELAFGPENISSGACGDLESVWKRSSRAFGRWGFAPDMWTA
jgi:cell division protease FtsH